MKTLAFLVTLACGASALANCDDCPDWLYARGDFSHQPGQRAIALRAVRLAAARSRAYPTRARSAAATQLNNTFLRGTDGSTLSIIDVQSYGNSRGGFDAQRERAFDASLEQLGALEPFRLQPVAFLRRRGRPRRGLRLRRGLRRGLRLRRRLRRGLRRRCAGRRVRTGTGPLGRLPAVRRADAALRRRRAVPAELLRLRLPGSTVPVGLPGVRPAVRSPGVRTPRRSPAAADRTSPAGADASPRQRLAARHPASRSPVGIARTSHRSPRRTRSSVETVEVGPGRRRTSFPPRGSAACSDAESAAASPGNSTRTSPPCPARSARGTRGMSASASARTSGAWVSTCDRTACRSFASIASKRLGDLRADLFGLGVSHNRSAERPRRR